MKNFVEKLLLEDGVAVVTALPMDNSFNTEVIEIGNLIDNVGLNIDLNNVTDQTGVFYVDHRIKKDTNNVSAWAELTLGGGNPTVADADATHLINLNQLPKGQIRVRFVAAGGTPDGDATIWYSGREL